MKSIFSLLCAILITSISFSQSPDAINYQGVCKTNSGNVVSSSNIGIEFNIIEGSVSGPVIYSEEHVVTTNVNGVFSAEIGRGSATTGVFEDIDWGNDSYYLEISIDTTGGMSYNSVGISEFLSVPYAYHSDQADTSTYSSNAGNADYSTNAYHAEYADSVVASVDTLITSVYTLSALSNGFEIHITDQPLLESFTRHTASYMIYESGTLVAYGSTSISLSPSANNWIPGINATTTYDIVLIFESLNSTHYIYDSFTTP